MTQIAVTGALGVFGSAAIPRLQNELNATVIGTDLRPSPGTIACDIRDTDSLVRAFKGCEVVIHAAAALPSCSAKEITSVDVEGTKSALDAARLAGARRFIHLSSTAVYGLPVEVPTPESYPFSGVDPYSSAKIQAEHHCERARPIFEGLTILRPKTFLGEGRLGIFAMLFEWAAEGRDFPVLGSGRQRTQMLHVSDLVSAVLAVLRQPPKEVPGPYNLGARDFGTIAADFQEVLDAAGHGGRIRRLPVAPTVAVLRGAAALKRSPVYPRLIYKLLSDSYVDLTKASQEIGFAPEHSNSASLVETYNWWRSSDVAQAASAGSAHTQPWRQGLLRLAKPFFS
jgi:nucleoside-diphosphate-sugar epimerase